MFVGHLKIVMVPQVGFRAFSFTYVHWTCIWLRLTCSVRISNVSSAEVNNWKFIHNSILDFLTLSPPPPALPLICYICQKIPVVSVPLKQIIWNLSNNTMYFLPQYTNEVRIWVYYSYYGSRVMPIIIFIWKMIDFWFHAPTSVSIDQMFLNFFYRWHSWSMNKFYLCIQSINIF